MQPIKTKFYNLLRWSEKYIKTDMVYLAHGGFWLTLGQIVSASSAFLLSVALANLLPKEIYGNYKYILSIGGIIGALSLTGMNTAVVRAAAKGFDGSLRQSFLVQLRWGLIPLFVALGGGVYYFFNGNYILAASLMIIGLLLPLSNSANTYTAFLNGKNDYKALFKYSSLLNIFSALIIFLSIFIDRKVIILVIAYFLSNTIINLFLYFRTLKIFNPNAEQDPQTISYGKHLSLMNIIPLVASNIDKVLVFHYLGAVQLAVYFFAVAVPEQMRGLFKIVSALAFPKLSQKTESEVKSAVFNKMPKFLLIVSFAIVFYILIAPLLYKIFFPKYLESIFYSRIFSIALIFIATSTIFLNILQSQIKIESLYKFNITSSLLQIAVLFIMVNYFGIMGVILGRLFSSAVNLAYLSFLIKK